MALAPIARTTTVTIANPTPPTNVPVVQQGTPPTAAGLTPSGAPAPDQTNPWLAADPVNGAPAGQLSGLAEADGTEVHATYPGGQKAHSTDGNYSTTPNASHPSYNSRAKTLLLDEEETPPE